MQARHCLLPYPVSHDMLHHHHHQAGKTLFVASLCPMTCYIIIIMQARHCLLPYPVSHDMLHHHHHQAGKTLFVASLCPMTCYIIIIMQARHCLLPYPVSHDMLHHHHHAGKTLFVTLPCVPWHATSSSSCRQDTVCYLTLCPMPYPVSHDMLHHHHTGNCYLILWHATPLSSPCYNKVGSGGGGWGMLESLCPCAYVPMCPSACIPGLSPEDLFRTTQHFVTKFTCVGRSTVPSLWTPCCSLWSLQSSSLTSFSSRWPKKVPPACRLVPG